MAKRKKKKSPAKPVKLAEPAQVTKSKPVEPTLEFKVEPAEPTEPTLEFKAEPAEPTLEFKAEPVEPAEPTLEFKVEPAEPTEPTLEFKVEPAKSDEPKPVATKEFSPSIKFIKLEEPLKFVDSVEEKPITIAEEEPAKVEPAKVEPIKVESAKVKPAKVESVKVVEPFECPDVSVVIPMYNAERYITACLDSILAQTHKNFELIIVDDCSTDKSSDIVRSYIPKFGGRLNHFRLKKNTGGAGIPRNKGIALARGEYVMFVDSDDMITKTAVEENVTLARQYDSDVLYRTLYYKLSEDGASFELANVPKYKPGDVTVVDNDLDKRVKDMARSRYWLGPWRSFSKREFLLENEIFFPNIRPYEDLVWTHALLIYTKNFLRVPHPIYLYRDNEGSMTRVRKAPAESAKFYLNPIILGLKSLDTYIRGHAFFKGKPNYHYGLLENFFNGRFTSVFREEASELKPHELYEAIKDGFGKNLGEHDVLVAALCTALHTQQELTAEKLNNFKKYVVWSKDRIAALEARLAELKAQKSTEA